MKRVLPFLLALTMMLTLLAACGEHRHVYDNDCDTQCNECEETRTIRHVYTDDTDLFCNGCEEYRLVGTWSTTIDDQPGTIILHADGTGEVITHETTRFCTWEVGVDNTLTVIQTVKGIHYTLFNGYHFTVEGDTLTITNDKGNTLTLTKQ